MAQMKKFFLEIWNERPHFSEISGKPLFNQNHFQWHWQFSHILARSTHGKFALNKDNICLCLPIEHEAWTTWNRTTLLKPIYLDNKAKWDLLLEKKERLIQEYHKNKHEI